MIRGKSLLPFPILPGNRPPLVVAPAAADFQVAGGKSLELESTPLHQPDRRRVPRLDVRLHPVKLDLQEYMPEKTTHPLAHIPLPGMLGRSVITQVGALKTAPDNFVHIEDSEIGRAHV